MFGGGIRFVTISIALFLFKIVILVVLMPKLQGERTLTRIMMAKLNKARNSLKQAIYHLLLLYTCAASP